MSTKSGTIVVDNLPEQCTTIQLFAAFRRYGSILRAWRSHGSQGLVTFHSMQDAVAAVEAEDGKHVDGDTLKVTAAFFNASEPTRKGWWQCALCRWWNEHKSSQNVCQGYMCGIKHQENGIAAIEKQLESLHFPEEAPQTYFQEGPPVDMQQNYYPFQGDYQQAPYEPQVPEDQSLAPPPAVQSTYMKQPTQYPPYTYGPEQVPPAAAPAPAPAPASAPAPPAPPAGFGPPAYTPPTAVPPRQNKQWTFQEHPQHSPEIPVNPPPTTLHCHCVVVTNVPTNITDRTLNKVFQKFSGGGEISSWVKATDDFTPRPLAEGQVLFTSPEAALKAVEGESGRDVDEQKIWCNYAEELFVIAVQGEDFEHWASMLATEEKTKILTDINHRFRIYGKVNAVHEHEKTVFVEYFSLTSALDAISSEDKNVPPGSNFTTNVSLACSGTRWPCVMCLRINSSQTTACDRCGAQKEHINARAMKDFIHKTVTDPMFIYGDSYKGYSQGLVGHLGAGITEKEPRDMKKLPQGHVNGQNGRGPTSPPDVGINTNGGAEHYTNGTHESMQGAEKMNGMHGQNGTGWRGGMHKGQGPSWNRAGRGTGAYPPHQRPYSNPSSNTNKRPDYNYRPTFQGRVGGSVPQRK